MKGSSTLLALPLALALLLGGAAHAADGIESRPLQFAKGASSATVKGSIAGRQTIDYKLRARAGQTMSVTLKSGNPGLAFNVLPPGSQDVAIEGAIAQQNWSGTLPADGEYTVRTYLDRAGARRGEKASYTLTVAIDAAAAQSGGKESAALAATGRAAEHPDGRKRFIFFEKGKAVGADLSQADGNMTFRATKNAAGIYLIDAGDERYEIPESVIFGG